MDYNRMIGMPYGFTPSGSDRKNMNGFYNSRNGLKQGLEIHGPRQEEIKFDTSGFAETNGDDFTPDIEI
ncbi:hypothetical protein ENUP19_0161G0021 [Entamoeba nuttalli]|uniref:Uncharacterized protein n=2 Tax=Entamoeba nuttalli TaxID=412467 RepID=K2HCM6_ENTNP|nr:hypothetical protein ENU1_088540 [Entamoeba nuttalli P19]EKE40504.1 hypothetical protein ENU1_088540 [Entamoeba nuttalli P19]|eukprot:XP_008857162.1 hypothetical protein ENU1_088540 [Entamoeba nuttalli P19]